MPCYPDIASPCPVADRLGEVMQGDFCRKCQKTVIDLDALSKADRYRRIAEATGEPCVRYRAPHQAALAIAAIMAAGTVALPAAAKEAPAASAPAAEPELYGGDEIIVGGARRLTWAERAEYRRQARIEEQKERAERKREKRRLERAARQPTA